MLGINAVVMIVLIHGSLEITGLILVVITALLGMATLYTLAGIVDIPTSQDVAQSFVSHVLQTSLSFTLSLKKPRTLKNPTNVPVEHHPYFLHGLIPTKGIEKKNTELKK